MAWNELTREQMEAQLLRQAQTIGEMREALKLALEYWAHRQQRYKNRHPVWVQKANAALGIATPNVTGY